MKMKLLSLAAAALVMLGASNALAQLSISIVANPFVDGSYGHNAAPALRTVSYTVTNSALSTQHLSSLFLIFEPDVFTSFSLTSASIGMTPVTGFIASGSLLISLPGFVPTLAPGSSMVLTVAYMLDGPALSNQWDSGLWKQSFTGLGSLGGVSSGLTTAATPEPGTLVLLGTGLLGTGLVQRFRQRRKT